MVMSTFVCYNTCQSVLDVLEAVEFRFRETDVEGVAVVKLGLDQGSGNVDGGGAFRNPEIVNRDLT